MMAQNDILPEIMGLMVIIKQSDIDHPEIR